MARGWESKDVESQREARYGQTSPYDKPVTEAQKTRQKLELDRIRLQRELQSACHPRFRGQLEAELAHIDAALKDLPS
jgi:hypothetical protein